MLRKLILGFVLLVATAFVALVLFARGAIGGEAVRRALEAELTARLGRPVRIGSLGASFVPRVTLDLREVTVGDPPAATIGTIAFATGLRGLFSRRVENAAVLIGDGRVPASLAAGLAAAVAGGTPTSGADGFTIVSVRTLAFRNLEIVAGSRSLVLDLASSLEGDRLEVTRLSARSAGTLLQARGALSSLSRQTGAFTATADRLNLDELLAVVLPGPAATGSRGRRAEPAPLDVSIDLSAPSGQFGGYEFQQLSSTLRLTPERVTAQPVRFRLFKGEYDGAIRIASTGAAPQVALNGRMAGIDMPALLGAVSGAASMTGTLAGTLSMSGRGSTANDVLRTSTGTARIGVTDGVIPRLELVRTIVLAFGKPSGIPPAGSGSAFSHLGGTFTLAGQVLRSDDFTLTSRDFDLAGRVTLGVPSGVVNLHANVVLSRELTEQAGTDLRRYAQEDGRVVVPVTITGTVAAPSVGVDVAGVLNRAIQNELKRRVKGLFDRIIKK